MSVALLSEGGEPMMRIARAAAGGTELLRNGGFEEAPNANLTGWAPGPRGFVLASGQGRNGSQSLGCENPDGRGWYGASQTISLNQSNALPLAVKGWSKAFNVSGSSDSDYSLYVDLLYEDGTPLWGQTANFSVGTHDWQRRELIIVPEKPLKSATLHCLFRNHSGQAWFDDVSVAELRTQGEAMLFQGTAVVDNQRRLKPRTQGGRDEQLQTRDSLSLTVRDNQITSLKVAGKELATDAASGFLARDVAADSDFYGFAKGLCQELGLSLQAHYTAASNHIVVEGRISDTRGKDRAVTLVFALPVDAAGWEWGDDIRHHRRIEGRNEFSKVVSIRCGATGTMSLYPLGAVSGKNAGLALAIDMAHPGQYRLGYNAGTRQLFIAYDFGLVPDTKDFPKSADFRFVLYGFEPQGGFRAAFQRLMEIFPEYFAVRSTDQGLWMPFTDIGTVQGWQDFGFRYHEGNNRVAWDEAHGILSFRYTEPMTWWMRMPKESPRTIQEAERLRDEMARGQNKSDRRMAKVSQTAAMWDESNQPSLLFRDEPWCNGAVWSLNPNPNLPSEHDVSAPAGESDCNAATVHWNDKVRDSLYGSGAKGRLDGEYLDSLEGYVTADLNFRREHFRYSSVPLTFASDTKQPALFKGLAVFEFERWFCGQVHQLGRLTFANGVPYRFSFLCPWLDVLGTETDWVRGGKYAPVSDEQMSLWRTMAGGKPYLLLMNTDFDVFNRQMVERYFQRSLFYGMFPGMFSHNAADNPYWQNPKWYNRDRPLFRKYMPIIKEVAEAGWRPVTCASCDNSNIFIERFGPTSGGTVYFTVFNDTSSPQRGAINIDRSALGLSGAVRMQELISGTATNNAAIKIELESQEAKVLELTVAK